MEDEDFNKRPLSESSDIDLEVYNTPKQARLKSPVPADTSSKLDLILTTLQNLSVEVNKNTFILCLVIVQLFIEI